MSLFRSAAFWFGLLITALVSWVSWELREVYVEPSAAALTCNVTPHPGWCAVRFAILIGQHNSLFGAAALVAGVVALFRGGRGPALTAAALAAAAIVNYNVEMGALALVFGLIASVRARPAREPRDGAPRA